MGSPEPARTWPARPLTTAEARALYESDEAARAVWVLDYEVSVRERLVPDDTPADAVVDVVLEADDSLRVFSYSGCRWLDYGTVDTDGLDSVTTEPNLDNYRVLAGHSRALRRDY